MTDRKREAELDTLLDAVAAPKVPEGAMARLMRTVEEPQAQHETVVPIGQGRRKGAASLRHLWRPGLALAASLLLGVYLGQAEFVDEAIGDVFTTASADQSLLDETLYWLSLDPDAIAEDT